MKDQSRIRIEHKVAALRSNFPPPKPPRDFNHQLKEEIEEDYCELMAPSVLMMSILDGVLIDDGVSSDDMTRLIRQVGIGTDKQAGFLILTLIADTELLPGLPDGFRKLAIKERTELYRRVTDPQTRLTSGNSDVMIEVAQTTPATPMDKIICEIAESLKLIEQNLQRPQAAKELKNFDGYLLGEVVDENEKLLKRGTDMHEFVAVAGQRLRLRAWLSRKTGKGREVFERLIVTDGREPQNGESIRFEISADASEPNAVVMPAALPLVMTGGKPASEKVTFYLEQGLPEGEHCLWLSCYQGYHLLQGMEVKVKVQGKTKASARKPR